MGYRAVAAAGGSSEQQHQLRGCSRRREGGGGDDDWLRKQARANETPRRQGRANEMSGVAVGKGRDLRGGEGSDLSAARGGGRGWAAEDQRRVVLGAVVSAVETPFLLVTNLPEDVTRAEIASAFR